MFTFEIIRILSNLLTILLYGIASYFYTFVSEYTIPLSCSHTKMDNDHLAYRALVACKFCDPISFRKFHFLDSFYSFDSDLVDNKLRIESDIFPLVEDNQTNLCTPFVECKFSISNYIFR